MQNWEELKEAYGQHARIRHRRPLDTIFEQEVASLDYIRCCQPRPFHCHSSWTTKLYKYCWHASVHFWLHDIVHNHACTVKLYTSQIVGSDIKLLAYLQVAINSWDQRSNCSLAQMSTFCGSLLLEVTFEVHYLIKFQKINQSMNTHILISICGGSNKKTLRIAEIC